ncbi:MAG: (2E,6E)-farnesyl diphosphate synthase [bacterium]
MIPANTHADLSQRLPTIQSRIHNVLDQLLPQATHPPQRLHKAMRYSALSGGKRVRPFLVYAAGECFGVEQAMLDLPAAAVEMIHVYSLIHDDLPAMDDDDLRRGQPTNHKAFDEATAILAGDALQTLAFQILAEDSTLYPLAPEVRLRLLSCLTQAAGAAGMVGGQAIDLAAVGQALTEQSLEAMHLRKTGALIQASVLMGAMCAPNAQTTELEALRSFATHIGLAFQVQDDILDIESDTATLGKPQGADLAADKPTYPSILGLDAAKQKLYDLHDQALNALAPFDHQANTLRKLANFIVQRVY